MATAIRTGIDNALKASLATISDLTHTGATEAAIFFNPSRMIQESESKPYGLIATDSERIIKSNQYREAQFLAAISIWCDGDDNDEMYPRMIDYYAQIVQAIIPENSLIRQAPGLVEIEEDPNMAMDTFFLENGTGILVVQYNIRYRTAYGNPFLVNPI